MKEVEGKILIVDDEVSYTTFLAHLIRREGFEVLTANDGETALSTIDSSMPDVMLVDFKMPGMNGMEVMKKAKERDPELAVIMITGFAAISGAVESMRAGAHDYLAKPCGHCEVMRAVRRALAERRLRNQTRRLSSEIEDRCQLRKTMGPSEAVEHLISDVNLVAQSDFSVVIMGETGSGKELVARAIQQASARAETPFIPIDCGSIPENLLESELFGHERGAFTGAVSRKLGKFELARGGTLFLDEISNMPWGSQAKLLRTLQEKKIYRLGGNKAISIDVRLLVASNVDLLELTSVGGFRLDLFFRLNEFTINIPPLRQRKQDIPYLANLFLDTTNHELNKSVKGFSEGAIEKLLNYHWPGNVRQLRSVTRRAVLLADHTITEKHIDITEKDTPAAEFMPRVSYKLWEELPLKEIVRQGTLSIEKEVLTEVLKHTGGNKAKAARILKMDYKTIHTKTKQYGIQVNGDVHDNKEANR